MDLVGFGTEHYTIKAGNPIFWNRMDIFPYVNWIIERSLG